jgi:CheY-like chemotaxis protein
MAKEKKDSMILVAEDEGINRLYITSLLKKHSYSHIDAENGRIAVDLYKDKDISLILMDVSMPELDGMDAAREIRRYEEEAGKKRVPIIALTAHAYREDMDRCSEAGMDAVLSKPYAEQQIIELIRKMLMKDGQ